MAEFLKVVFERLEQAPVASAAALIIFLIAAPLIIRIWRATGPGQPAPAAQPALEQSSPWIGMQILHQTDAIGDLGAKVDRLAGKVDDLEASIDEAVDALNQRGRNRPRRGR